MRRQILTSQVDPRDERANPFTTSKSVTFKVKLDISSQNKLVTYRGAVLFHSKHCKCIWFVPILVIMVISSPNPATSEWEISRIMLSKYYTTHVINAMQCNEKHRMRLNPRCPELRGAANPNQARFYCPLAIPFRRSSMTGHDRTGWKNRNIKFSFFFEMTFF